MYSNSEAFALGLTVRTMEGLFQDLHFRDGLHTIVWLNIWKYQIYHINMQVVARKHFFIMF